MITLSSDDSGNSAWKRALIVILACTLVVWIYGLRVSQRFKHRNLPGPTPGWLVGQVGDLLKLGQPKAFQKWGEVYGPGLHTILLGSHGLVNICQPDTARKILYLPYRFDFEEHSIFPGFIRKQNDESILWRRGSKWRDLRAAWQPMFFTGSLEKYVPIFDRAALLLAKEISWAAAEGRVIDVYPMVQEMSMDVIGRAAFGVDLHAQKAETAEISTAERERGALIRQAAQDFFIPQNSSMWVVAGRLFPILLPVIRYLAERYPDEPLAKIIQSRVTIKKVVEDLIHDHRLSLGSGKEHPGGLKKDGTQGVRRGVAPGSFIDLLVQSTDRVTGQGLSDLNISEQVFTMLLGGFETTSSAITFALYLLAKPINSEQQAKAVAEVDTLGKEWVPTFADLEEKLPYLDAVLKESIRLYPPGHLVIREAETDMIVEDHRVAKGTPLYMSTYAIHNDPRVWGESVATFLPERWLTPDPDAAKKAKSSFFGFGDGPRVCPGSRFALTEAKMALVRILQKFTLELQPGQDPLALKDSITLSPGDGCRLRPIPRA